MSIRTSDTCSRIPGIIRPPPPVLLLTLLCNELRAPKVAVALALARPLGCTALDKAKVHRGRKFTSQGHDEQRELDLNVQTFEEGTQTRQQDGSRDHRTLIPLASNFLLHQSCSSVFVPKVEVKYQPPLLRAAAVCA